MVLHPTGLEQDVKNLQEGAGRLVAQELAIEPGVQVRGEEQERTTAAASTRTGGGGDGARSVMRPSIAVCTPLLGCRLPAPSYQRKQGLQRCAA